MAWQALFRQEYATRGSVLDFDYKHVDEDIGEDRKWVKVSVYIKDMKLDYQNVSGEHTGPHGEVAERGGFSDTSHLQLKGHVACDETGKTQINSN